MVCHLTCMCTTIDPIDHAHAVFVRIDMHIISGGGTSHRVNGIATQQKDLYEDVEQRVPPRVPKTKKALSLRRQS